jgi:hypothetical protein
MRVTLFVDRAAGFLGDAMAAITPQLTRIVRANFLAQLKPEKNLIDFVISSTSMFGRLDRD